MAYFVIYTNYFDYKFSKTTQGYTKIIWKHLSHWISLNFLMPSVFFRIHYNLNVNLQYKLNKHKSLY